GGDERRAVRRQLAVELGAAQGDERAPHEFELGPDDRDLQRRLARRVADQRIGERERYRVHGAARAEAPGLVAVAAQILHRGEEARPVDAQAHRWASFANASRSMGRNFTRSPVANRLGSWRAASNTASGVRPMTFQPPGISYG